MKPGSVASNSVITAGYSASPNLANDRCNCAGNEIHLPPLEQLFFEVTEVPSRTSSHFVCTDNASHLDQISFFSPQTLPSFTTDMQPRLLGNVSRKKTLLQFFFPWMLVHDYHAEEPELHPLSPRSLSSTLCCQNQKARPYLSYADKSV